jgi:two-component system cell cycle sensor histidine kinase/response regulator CckA
MMVRMAGERVTRALELRRLLGPFFERCLAPTIVLEHGGGFATANDAALAQYGYSLDELVAMRIHDIMALPRPELSADLEKAFQGQRPGFERRPHRRKDGSVIWVVPVAGPMSVDGQTVIVSVLQDVTALVSAEEQAHFEHGRVEVLWEGAIERNGGSFALLDAERRLVRVNRTLCEWMGRREDELLGKRCDEVFLTRCTRQPCAHAIALAERRRVVAQVPSRLGKPLEVQVLLAPPNDSGVALIHTGRDLSEERAVRSRLVVADRLATLDRLAAGVAHEVNNATAFVTLALPLAKDRIAQGRSEEAVALLDEAVAATGQIAEVMRDLGGVARDRPRALVDLAALAMASIRMASYEAETRASVECVLEDGVGAEVRGTRVSQVLLNLILNAAQAIPAGDAAHHRIEVRLRRSGECALLEVSDTGPGVPDAIGDRIFEPFFTTRGSLGGTGLGLWLSRNIVEEEGGTLTWRNRAEGGAVFTVSLPLHRAAITPARASAG